MKLVVGLGNPGPKYQLTRHNAGFLFVDLLAEAERESWSSKAKLQAKVTKIRLYGSDVLLCKPETYMNLSGAAVQAVMRFYKIALEDLLVVHDDIDLEFGRVRSRAGGGHGGHNGVRDIISCIGAPKFARLKLGVGRPCGDQARVPVTDWVLMPFKEHELEVVGSSMYQEGLLRLRQNIEKTN
ncbi:MAG: aminoacyl-tRNA hydrolase [Zetaproteobacteria bacterium]|nr:aminoacyl-tRNA hydrolase [Zetaproteobacteria bacterium]